MHALFVILIAQLVHTDLPPLQQMSCSLDDARRQTGLSPEVPNVHDTRILLKGSCNVAALESFLINGQSLQDLKYCLDHLKGRKGMVGIGLQPSFQRTTALILEEQVFHRLFLEHASQVLQ